MPTTVHWLPLEHLEERYTAQLDRWVRAALESAGLRVVDYRGEALEAVSGAGDFLPFASRAHFALTQAAELVRAWHAGAVHPGDVVLAADLWHPGLEAIGYVKGLRGSKAVRVGAIHYAGPFDPDDITARALGDWGKRQELAWLDMVDAAFVGSHHHAGLIWEGSLGDKATSKLKVVGLPFDAASVRSAAAPWPKLDGRPVVLWPHRVAPEKDFDAFYRLAAGLAPQFPGVRWIVSSSRLGVDVKVPAPLEYHNMPKAEYYGLMRSARCVVSTARQETFGYTLHEAATLGVPYYAPARACYPDLVAGGEWLYATQGQLAEKVAHAIEHEAVPVQVRPTNAARSIADWCAGKPISETPRP